MSGTKGVGRCNFFFFLRGFPKGTLTLRGKKNVCNFIIFRNHIHRSHQFWKIINWFDGKCRRSRSVKKHTAYSCQRSTRWLSPTLFLCRVMTLLWSCLSIYGVLQTGIFFSSELTLVMVLERGAGATVTTHLDLYMLSRPITLHVQGEGRMQCKRPLAEYDRGVIVCWDPAVQQRKSLLVTTVVSNFSYFSFTITCLHRYSADLIILIVLQHKPLWIHTT